MAVIVSVAADCVCSSKNIQQQKEELNVKSYGRVSSGPQNSDLDSNSVCW